MQGKFLPPRHHDTKEERKQEGAIEQGGGTELAEKILAFVPTSVIFF
jgi:hypothetical protein